MKRVLSIVLFSTCCMYATAQVSFQANAPRNGDNVVRNTISLTSPGQCSDFAIWDLSDMETGSKKHVMRHVKPKVNGDSLCVYDAGTRYVLELREDGASVAGYENRDVRLTFDSPVKVLRFPMEHGDSLGGSFHGSGIYCDRWRLRQFGFWTLRADAKGRVVMPSGDSLAVIRVHLQKRTSNRYYPMDSARSVLTAFNVDSILHYQETDTAVMVCDEYRWYARGYRYPVLEYRSVHMESRPGVKTSVAYFCPPENQEKLPLDEENTKIRENDRETGEGGNGKHDSGDGADGNGFGYCFSQDGVGKRVNISYTADSPVSVKAILASTIGIVYKTETSGKGTTGDITIDYGDLPHGQYIVYIKTAGEIHTEKFNHK